MIDIKVLPRIAVEGRTFDVDTLVISISAPREEPPKIIGDYVYKFYFEDVTEEYFLPGNDYRGALLVRPMEYEIAESIVEIVMNHRDKKKWIIHCAAGISRSPGVAIGLSRHIDLSLDVCRLMDLFPSYNKHVERMVDKAMKAKLLEIELNIRERFFIDPHGF